MRKLLIRSAQLLAVLCGWLCFSMPAWAAENCHTPEPQELIRWYHQQYPHQPLRYSAESSLIYHPIEVFQTRQPRINWIGLAWLSPEWGALFTADCQGRPLAAVSVGAVGKIIAGPELPALGQTVMFIYVDKETADCVHDSAAIVALKDGRIISLWSHAYRQGMNIGARGHPPTAFLTHNYTLALADGGRSLHLSGMIRQYPFRKDGSQSPTPDTSRVLPQENYRWDAKHLRYVAQRNYPQTPACVPVSLQGSK